MQWVGGDSFGATLVDMDSEEEISADIYRHLVQDDDAELLMPGALFVWTVEDEGSTLTFRRPEENDDAA